MTRDEVVDIVARVKLGGPFADKWFHVGDLAEVVDAAQHYVGHDLHVAYVQVRYMEPDIHTGEMAQQRARVWVVPPDATESQVVQICFGAALASAEHQCREFFTYEVPCEACEGLGPDYPCPHCGARGVVPRRVFGPHMDIAGLASVAR